MPLNAFPVTVSCSIAGVASTIVVETAAASPAEAVAIARLLASTVLRLRHPGQEPQFTSEPVVGPAGAAVNGLHIYVLGEAPRIARFDFADRLEPAGAARLGEKLATLPIAGLYSVIIDAVNLTYISSLGLGTLAGNAQRLNLRLIRANANVRKIIGLVGIDRVVSCHADLPAACADLVAPKKD